MIRTDGAFGLPLVNKIIIRSNWVLIFADHLVSWKFFKQSLLLTWCNQLCGFCVQCRCCCWSTTVWMNNNSIRQGSGFSKIVLNSTITGPPVDWCIQSNRFTVVSISAFVFIYAVVCFFAVIFFNSKNYWWSTESQCLHIVFNCVCLLCIGARFLKNMHKQY